MDKKLLDEIIFRYKYPNHRGVNKGQVHHAENLSCGDEIDIYLDIQNDTIKSASFSGSLCSIASFGADLLLENLIGQPVSKINELNSGKLLGEIGAPLLKNPVRLKCFEIAKLALKDL